MGPCWIIVALFISLSARHLFEVCILINWHFCHMWHDVIFTWSLLFSSVRFICLTNSSTQVSSQRPNICPCTFVVAGTVTHVSSADRTTKPVYASGAAQCSFTGSIRGSWHLQYITLKVQNAVVFTGIYLNVLQRQLLHQSNTITLQSDTKLCNIFSHSPSVPFVQWGETEQSCSHTSNITKSILVCMACFFS